MQLTLFTANCAGNKANCSYPNKVHITNASELQEAVKADHVCAEYKDNYRSIDNFISSDCLVMDIDNDHSENPADWLTAEKIESIYGDVDYVLTTSRHHMIVKEGKAARPKYHIYFQIEACNNSDSYASMKAALQKQYNFFDDNALDSARFLFGAESDVVWHEGWLTIEDLLDRVENFDEEDISSSGPILEGSRNNTMSRFAGRVLKRYGITEKARDAFLEHAKKCDPPLPDDELDIIWTSAIRFFNKKVISQEGYVPPDEYNVDFEGFSLKPEDYSDIGEAKVLVREYGNELKYTNATDYLRYDGNCWQEDKQLAIGAVEEFLDLQLADAQDEVARATEALIGAGVPEDIIKTGGAALVKAVPGDQIGIYFMFLGAQAYLKFVLKRRDYKFIIATSNTAKPMLAISVSDLDKDENLLNTPVATYNLKKGLAGEQPHDPGDLITKMTTCSPGEEGKQLWLDTLDRFFCKDQEFIDYVQQVVGMASIGKVYQEHMIIAYGGGANGKSTFWNTISRILGSYSGKISAETLTMNCKRNVKPEMAELKGKRLIIASEMEEGTRLNTGVVKQLSSTDEIQAEKKYKDPFKFVPSHTLVLYTNHLPKVGANDDGIWRRLIVIPFNAKITGKSDIKNFADHLFEYAGPSIMSWIIEGAEKAIAAHFKTELPGVVKEAIKAYREDNDWLGQFETECCELDPSYKEKSGDVYQAYRAYCMRNGEFIRSTSDFYLAMDKAGFSRRRSSKGVQIHGLKLKEGQDFLD
ncbi:MAG: primase C-terminal domain-containing protein [Dethiosulfatibacter sp.]|nr:primase C-terminal domain-containing protein [Dethiosulfatibacter sp.]